jgi:steroid delta-isomerase-like uncharacterized protein
MSVERNKQRLQRLYDEMFNAGNLEVAHELIAANAVDHEQLPPEITGTVPEQLQQFVSLMRSAFPDLRVTAHDMIGEGDKAVARIAMTGTHQGDFLGIPATGRQVDVQVIDMVRFDDAGVMVEHWAVTDNLGMMRQLGVIPQAA